MTYGKLRYNPQWDRIGIVDPQGEWTRDGLYCGEALEVRLGEKWTPTRLEYSGSRGWFLIGLFGIGLEGLEVRIS